MGGTDILGDEIWGDAEVLEGGYVDVSGVWSGFADGWVLVYQLGGGPPAAQLTPKNDRAQSKCQAASHILERRLTSASGYQLPYPA